MEIILKAEPRKRAGSRLNKLRKEGWIPAVIFGKGKKSKNIKVRRNDLVRLINHVGETEVVYVHLQDKKTPVLISEVQIHPVKNIPIHVNLHQIDLKKKVTVNVPIEFIGQEEHPLLKNKNALLLSIVDEVPIEALPSDLPKEITLKIDKLKEIGDVLTIKDIKESLKGKKIEVLEEDNDMVIAKLDYPEQIEEEEEGPQSVEDVEVTSEKQEQSEELGKKEDNKNPQNENNK